jgi:RNA recognition motif-containing protein
MLQQILFVNLPYNCSEQELNDWIRSRGVKSRSVRIIHDLVSGVSPAFGYASVDDEISIPSIISALNGKKMRDQTITVKLATWRNAAA